MHKPEMNPPTSQRISAFGDFFEAAMGAKSFPYDSQCRLPTMMRALSR